MIRGGKMARKRYQPEPIIGIEIFAVNHPLNV
jgi:hypothetical protein